MTGPIPLRTRAELAVAMLEQDPNLSMERAAQQAGTTRNVVRAAWRAKHPESRPRPRPRTSSLVAVAIRLLRDTNLPMRHVARDLGVSLSAVHRGWRREMRVPRPRGRSRHDTTRSVWVEPFATLCDVMLESLTGEMHTVEWFAAVTSGYGAVGAHAKTPAANKRRFWRGVKRLLDTGRIVRADRGTYRRAP